MRIEILLSTFNGERFLREQLDSILAQTHEDWHLTARDDGSKDGTAGILREYAAAHPERITFAEDGRKLGYPDCFWKLLEEAPAADLYAFCDQDDVWRADKLVCCEEMCRGEDPGRPLLYVHDYRISDGELNVYDTYHMKEAGYREDYPWSLLYFVMTSGFAMALNGALRERILRDKPAGKGLPHDRWIFWCGYFAGKILGDERTTVTYRRHERTVTETGKGNGTFLKEWWTKEIRGDRMARWEEMGLRFTEDFREEMERKRPGIRKDWRVLCKGEKGVGNYFRRLFFPKRLKPSLAGEAALRISFLLNK